MGQLSGRVALITGGGSGVGFAAAKLFLHEGAKVAIAGRNAEKLAAAAKELGGGPNLLAHRADVTDAKQAEDLVRLTTDKFGRVDVLMNNAGMNIKQRSVRELTPKVWREMVAANLDGAFYCALLFYRRCANARMA